MVKKVDVFLADLAHTTSVANESLTVPLNIGYVKSYAVKHFGNAVDVSLFKHPEKFSSKLLELKPKVVGLANYGWNENLNLMMGNYIRQKFPEILIIAGGPNVDPNEQQRLAFLQKHSYVDFLIIDGGEQPFKELLEWWFSGDKDYTQVPANVVWLEGGQVQHSDERKLKKELDDIESPYLSGYLDEFLSYNMVPLLETNRGCPFACTFCAWGSAAKNLVQRFDIEQPLAEIEYVGARSKASNWIICDANFGILERDVKLAHAIRRVKDETGYPKKCHIWLAKNITARNLEIGEILGDMTVPVMAVQSLDTDVLKKIKRSNISTDTYKEYQQKFHKMGSQTYSDLIVPLPGETIDTHMKSLRTLFELKVDLIVSHNMRLLAGAETNSPETREQYNFKTKYRLIHGDAGEYKVADGKTIRCFEYEESLRSTDTMSELDIFYLRKLHFLVEFTWNLQSYKTLLLLAMQYKVNPIEIMNALIENKQKDQELARFFKLFDESSHEEWFDSPEDIETYFAKPKNFHRLLNQEFEKLNIQFSIILFKDYKEVFDRAILALLQSIKKIPQTLLENVAAFSFSEFSPLNIQHKTIRLDLTQESASFLKISPTARKINFVENKRRSELRKLIVNSNKVTLSKVLDTQGFSLQDLRMHTSF